jgi:hypothetical protein
VPAAFTCTHCHAVPEQVVDARAAIAIVDHELGGPILMAQTRTRWRPAAALSNLARPSHPPANGVYREVSADCDEIAPNVSCRQ